MLARSAGCGDGNDGKDRKRMPYTQAVLLEILRYSTPVAMVSKCPLRDEAIMKGEYEIPKVCFLFTAVAIAASHVLKHFLVDCMTLGFSCCD